ncbi:MAG: DUF2079 domain-containing protein [Chloroflexota bacterium]
MGKDWTSPSARSDTAPAVSAAAAAASQARAIALRRALVWSLVVAYVLFFSLAAVLRHETFNSSTFDLAIADQALWTTLHGQLLGITLEPDVVTSDFGYHFELIMLAIVPLYWLYANVNVILVLQTVALALGALPASWLAYRRLHSNVAAVVFALAYLLFPALHSTNMFDFHAFSLSAPFLLFAFYYMDIRNYGAFAVAAFLAMSTRQNIPLTIALMGLYIALLQRRWRVGLVTVAVSVAWFGFGTYVVVPAFNMQGQDWLWNRYPGMSGGPLNFIGYLLSNPGHILEPAPGLNNVEYFFRLLLPVYFLPLLHPASLLLTGPGLATNMLTTYEPMHLVETYHYVASLVPLLIASAICGASVAANWAGRFGAEWRRLTVWVLCGLVLVVNLGYNYYWGYTPLSPSFSLTLPNAHHEVGRRFVGMIPQEASVSAQFNLGPHVSQRLQFSMFPAVSEAEYIFLDVSTQPNSVAFWEGFHERIAEVLASPDYGVVAAEDGFLLLKRGAPRMELPDQFYSFARAGAAVPQHQLSLRYGDAVELVGFDTHTGRDGKLDLTLYWRALRPLSEDLFVAVYLTDGEGKELGATKHPQPANVWYPTSRWPVGETVAVRTLSLPWDPRGQDFGLAVGVLDADDPWDVGARLPIAVQAAEWRVGAVANGALAELLRVRNDHGLLTKVLPPRPRAAAAPGPSLADFAGKVALRSAEVDVDTGGTLRPGGELRLRLHWDVRGRLDASYTTFVQLLAPGPRVAAQKDALPLAGTFPTTFWLPGDSLDDEYVVPLPADLAAGHYSLIVGLYDNASGARLPVALPDGRTADHYLVSDALRVAPR